MVTNQFIKFSETPTVKLGPSPSLSENRSDILIEMGYSEKEIDLICQEKISTLNKR